jgi:hypothetical protein
LFEELPLIIGDKLGSPVNLGYYLNLFLCIFPVLFLVGQFAKKSFSLPRASMYYFLTLVCLLLDLLLFNLCFARVKNFLAAVYGLIQEKAELLALFVFLAVWIVLYLAVLFAGRRMMRKKLVPSIRERFEEMERDYHAAACRAVSIERQFNRRLQAKKSEDLYSLFHGMKAEFDRNYSFTDDGICLLNSGMDELSAVTRKISSGIETFQASLDRMRNGIEAIIRGNVSFKSTFTSIFKSFENRFPVQSFYSAAAIAKAAGYAIVKEYDSMTIRFDLKSTGKIYCTGNELIQAFTFILQNLIDAQTDPFNEIILRSRDEEPGIVVEIEDFEKEVEEKGGEPLLNPLCRSMHDQRGIRYFISRMYIEKNEGVLQYRRKREGGGVITVLFQKIKTHDDLEINPEKSGKMYEKT